MAKRHTRAGMVQVFLPEDFTNAVLSVLTCFMEIGESTVYADYANRLRNLFFQYGRTFVEDGVPYCTVQLFEKEAALLIKLLAFYISTGEVFPKDYTSEIGKQRKA